jgi:hypothetical protein
MSSQQTVEYPTRILNKSAHYPCACSRYIPQFGLTKLRAFSALLRFSLRTENPRVGGSIPPLATNINEIDDQFLAISLIFRRPD